MMRKTNHRPSVKEIISIHDRLQTVLENVEDKTADKSPVCRYIDAKITDASIAAELEVSPVSVASIRKRMFGQLVIRAVAAEELPDVAAASNVGSRKGSHEAERQ
jgi:hypothetical protein